MLVDCCDAVCATFIASMRHCRDFMFSLSRSSMLGRLNLNFRKFDGSIAHRSTAASGANKVGAEESEPSSWIINSSRRNERVFVSCSRWEDRGGIELYKHYFHICRKTIFIFFLTWKIFIILWRKLLLIWKCTQMISPQLSPHKV